MQFRRFLAGILIAWLFAPLSGCSRGGAASGPPEMGPRAANVAVEFVTQEEVVPKIVVVGTVTPRKTSVVASGAEGKVDQFLVREGQIVYEGQPLSVLNMVTTDLGIAEAQQVLEERREALREMENGSRPEEIIEARARMEAAQVTKSVAADRLARALRLSGMGATRQEDLDEARERSEAADRLFEAAKAQYDLVVLGSREEAILQARARVEAQQNQVDYLIAEKAKRTTMAPFPGIIVKEHTEAGQWLSKGAPVVTIADITEEVHVVANVDQRNLQMVQVGTEVEVEIEATAQRFWKGRVITVVPRSEWESGSRTFPVKVAVKNQFTAAGDLQIPQLSEGMYARVTFAGTPRIAKLVPKDAIIRSEVGSKVFAVIEQDGLKVRPVMLREGDAFGARVEILGEDLAVGERVVTEGAERLTPFASINILKTVEPAAVSTAATR